MAEGVAEVADLDVGHVLDDADEVRAGGCAGHAEIAFAEAVQLPQQCVAIGLEIVSQCSLGLFQIAHVISLDRNLGFRLRATRNGQRNSVPVSAY